MKRLTVLTCVVIAACTGERAGTADTSRAARTPSAEGVPAVGGRARPATVNAVQLASLGDSARAAAMRDSLAREGWTAFVTAATVDGDRRYRVQVQPTASTALPRLIAHALRQSGREAVVVSEAPSASYGTEGEVEVHEVNRGTHGMAAQTRWTLSVDRRSILVVEDPAAVEAEPVPNGFVFASETSPTVLQQDGVWDVSPSPDWRRLAWGRAWVVSARERDSLSRAQWDSLARVAGLPVAQVRRGAFAASGMAVAVGLARPVLAELPPPGSGVAAAVLALPLTAGWRARWASPSVAAFGLAPRASQDYSPSLRWVTVDASTGAVRDTIADSTALGRVAWVEGPTLDISVRPDLETLRTIPVGSSTVESRDGWIRLRGRTSDGRRTTRLIGPGAALAATATGRFLVALAPDPDAQRYEAPVRLVVYQVSP